MKNRREQLLPLLPLLCKLVPVSKKLQQKIKKAGIVEQVPDFPFHFLSILDIIFRELSLPAVRTDWINNAHVRPVAKGVEDGEVFRSSPQYTFGFIDTPTGQYQLGANVLARSSSGVKLQCKIISLFLHTDSDSDLTEPACYVQLYQQLSAVTAGGDSGCLQAKRESRGDQELVLTETKILLKGASLVFIQKDISVIEDSKQLSHDNDLFLCRYAIENDTLRPLSEIHRHPTDTFDHSKLFTNLEQAAREGVERDTGAYRCALCDSAASLCNGDIGKSAWA